MMLHRLKSAITREERNKLNENFRIIETLLNALKNQMNNIVASAGKDNSENVAARTNTTINKSYTSVGDRLDKEYAAVQAKFTTKADQSFVDAQFASIVSGSPKGTFTDYAALVAKYPSGAEGTMLVLADGHWYYWNDVTGKWEDGGVYQAQGIADGSVTPQKTNFIQEFDTKIISDNYVNGIFQGNAEVGMHFLNSEQGRVIITSVAPNTTYQITKGLSNRFRVALHTEIPTENTKLSRVVKDEYTTGQNESSETKFEFTTNISDKFVVIYVSNISEEPKVTIHKTSEGLMITETVTSKNIVKSKNLFNGQFVRGNFNAGYGSYSYLGSNSTIDNFSFAVELTPSTTYTISKTPSNRFQIVLFDTIEDGKRNVTIDSANVIKTDNDGDSYTFSTGATHHSAIVYVASNSQHPEFVQVEENDIATDWETYGYKFSEHAQPYKKANDGFSNGNAVIWIEDYRQSDMSDSDVIQSAFDDANGQVVEFESGRVYTLSKTVTAHASKIRGIIGNNATLKGVDGVPALQYHGSKITAGAYPMYNYDIMDTEMSVFIKDLKVTSVNEFLSDGIELKGLFSPLLQNVFAYGLRDAIIYRGVNRNINMTSLNVYNNARYGIFFDNVNIHQCNVVNSQIAFNLCNIKFLNCDFANFQCVGNDIENAAGVNSFTAPESIISIQSTKTSGVLYEAFVIASNTLQDHRNNVKPMIDIDVYENQMHDILIDGNLIGNSSSSQPPIYIKGANGIGVTNNAIVGYATALFSQSVVLDGDNKNVRILGNQLDKPINHNDATITKMLVANNLCDGFTITDSSDGNIVYANNL